MIPYTTLGLYLLIAYGFYYTGLLGFDVLTSKGSVEKPNGKVYAVVPEASTGPVSISQLDIVADDLFDDQQLKSANDGPATQDADPADEQKVVEEPTDDDQSSKTNQSPTATSTQAASLKPKGSSPLKQKESAHLKRQYDQSEEEAQYDADKQAASDIAPKQVEQDAPITKSQQEQDQEKGALQYPMQLIAKNGISAVKTSQEIVDSVFHLKAQIQEEQNQRDFLNSNKSDQIRSKGSEIIANHFDAFQEDAKNQTEFNSGQVRV